MNRSLEGSIGSMRRLIQLIMFISLVASWWKSEGLVHLWDSEPSLSIILYWLHFLRQEIKLSMTSKERKEKKKTAYRAISNYIRCQTVPLHLIKQFDSAIELSVLDQNIQYRVTHDDVGFDRFIFDSVVYFQSPDRIGGLSHELYVCAVRLGTDLPTLLHPIKNLNSKTQKIIYR